MGDHSVSDADSGVDNSLLPPDLDRSPNRLAASNGQENCRAGERTGVTASASAPCQRALQTGLITAHTRVVLPMPTPPCSMDSRSSDPGDPETDDAQNRAAHEDTSDLARWLEGHVAQVVRVLDCDRHPITSREEAARLELLPEWEHLGRLCVCREALPPMPRWLPRCMATQLLADAEARCPGSSMLHLISVEFADGFVTTLERDELRILPLKRSGFSCRM